MEAGKSLNGRGKKSGEEKSRTKILFSFLTFLRPIFFLARLDFFLPPLTATWVAEDAAGRSAGKFRVDRGESGKEDLPYQPKWRRSNKILATEL